ncbi:hypothetical protein LEN26_002112 [Aphanomyces euteiches]|nr:hypothetical protein LEN26_002112 [Aphanomyces euteiches]
MRTDRLSIESGVEFVDDAYASVKTPDVADGGTSLRPTDRPVSIYNVKNLGLAAHIAGVGVVYGTLTGVIYAVLNNYLHMSTTLVATATALVTFPRSLRVFTGMLTDRVPIFGYRRRPYLILGWLLSFVSCLLMALFPLGDPYYRDPALSKIAATKLTAAQKAAGINLDAPQHGIKLIVLLAFAHLGVIVAFCGYHGVLVDLSQREPEHLRGTALGNSRSSITCLRVRRLLLLDDWLQRNHVDLRGRVAADDSVLDLPFATVLTKTIDGYFNIDRAQIKADTPHVRTQVTWMYSIMYVVNLASLAFVVFLPTREKDATARDGSYEQEESLLGHVDHRLLALFVGVDAHDKHIEPLDLDQLSPHCWWQRLLGNT